MQEHCCLAGSAMHQHMQHGPHILLLLLLLPGQCRKAVGEGPGTIALCKSATQHTEALTLHTLMPV
jgi:hypothetical protein